MCTFCNNFPLLLNIMGLICDIVGAFFIAYEVVRKFEGEMLVGENVEEEGVDSKKVVRMVDKYGSSHQYSADYTQVYKTYLKKRDFNMKIGLIILVLGFLVQIGSNIIQWKN